MVKKKQDIFENESLSISTSTEEYKEKTINDTEDRVKELLNLKPVRRPKKNNVNK